MRVVGVARCRILLPDDVSIGAAEAFCVVVASFSDALLRRVTVERVRSLAGAPASGSNVLRRGYVSFYRLSDKEVIQVCIPSVRTICVSKGRLLPAVCDDIRTAFAQMCGHPALAYSRHHSWVSYIS